MYDDSVVHRKTLFRLSIDIIFVNVPGVHIDKKAASLWCMKSCPGLKGERAR